MARRKKAVTSAKKKKGERWREILDVSAAIFYEHGFKAASMQQIGDELGMMKGSLYYYIESKEDILYALLKESHNASIDHLLSVIEKENTAIDRLRDVIINHIAFVGKTRILLTVYLREFRYLSAEQRKSIAGGKHSYQAIFKKLLTDCQTEGTLRKDIDVDLTATLILSSLNSTVRWMDKKTPSYLRRIGEHYADILLDGLRG